MKQQPREPLSVLPVAWQGKQPLCSRPEAEEPQQETQLSFLPAAPCHPSACLCPKLFIRIGPNAALIYTFCSLSKVDRESGICRIAEGVAISGEAAWHFL